MARKIENAKGATIADLVVAMEEEFTEEKPLSYQMTSPVWVSADNKWHVIIIMECFEESS